MSTVGMDFHGMSGFNKHNSSQYSKTKNPPYHCTPKEMMIDDIDHEISNESVDNEKSTEFNFGMII
jgi:hypothetical protein